MFLTISFLLGCVGAAPVVQRPLVPEHIYNTARQDLRLDSAVRPLYGRFLHITDLHPDPFYEYHSSTDEENACHRGKGPAGYLGAETTDCDAPFSLINATFQWINDNLKDKVDFVVWTGDSARHDNDEQNPRSEQQVSDLNNFVVNKFVEVFGKEDDIDDTDPTNDFIVSIVPTFGNNDILPHNIFAPGPNLWTKKYLDIWRQFIPEEQRHSFATGGWFFTEVIPGKLTIFSLNTLLFFDNNSAVDGCANPSEPGYQQFEWLRIQLDFLRARGVKVILTGHVAPARTESKASWDETCWQKYTLWVHQYRDIIVGSLYGHMNIDHFMLQDFEEMDLLASEQSSIQSKRESLGDEISGQSTADYLTELRIDWSHIPNPPKVQSKAGTIQKSGKPKKSKEDKYNRKIGGPWAERYSLSLVSPSLVPNYFPTLRVFEYNITGLDASPVSLENLEGVSENRSEDNKVELQSRPSFKTPKAPSKLAPPGPAYSPQTFTWLGYVQYYANITKINNDFTTDAEAQPDETMETRKWKEGKYHGEQPRDKNPKAKTEEFKFEVEYDTKRDKINGLKDLTVKSFVNLANRIGRYKAEEEDCIIIALDEQESGSDKAFKNIENTVEVANKGHKKKKHKKGKKKHDKHKKRKALNRVWFSFVKRAFVGTMDDEDIHNEFGQSTG
ncbi:MAG: hypothetical protein MMC33_005886 [Icmadophila ericetorum]|nr:hypothetical protein [Icmadophila ericetorum]